MLTIIVDARRKNGLLHQTLSSVKHNDYRGEKEYLVLVEDEAEVQDLKNVTYMVRSKKQSKFSLGVKNSTGDALLFCNAGAILSKDLLSMVADSVDNGTRAGTCLIKPAKKSVWNLFCFGINNLFSAGKNSKKLLFCTKSYAKRHQNRLHYFLFTKNARSNSRFKVVKSFVTVN
ncbi:hypothetical protein CL622_04320 [archaeon]|nr:hypothetical protein [archaeon]|tara:strand:- start:1008 stop:1529 length:522 start_codon:yes stop_codon:yes gene_type:complete